MTDSSNPINERLAILLDPNGPDWKRVPKVSAPPLHHFCSVIERGDIEAKMHSSILDIYDAGIKLDGKRNKTRLCQVLRCGPGRWVQGGRQPAEVRPDQLVYVKERTVPFRFHLRGDNHYFIAMDAVLAQLDPQALKLIPVGNHIITVHNEERERRAVMTGDLHLPLNTALEGEKRGGEADDIGCNARRIEEVVAVGPGKFGGYVPKLTHGDVGQLQLEMVPYWETPDVAVGDLVIFTDMARPVNITLAGKNYTICDYDHTVSRVED